MRISVVTIFPEFFASPLEVSLVARAQNDGALAVDLVDLRAHGIGAYRRVDDAPFAFAGLWEVWKDPNQSDDEGAALELYSCTIITGEPNEKVAEVHDRMPVMLPPDTWDEWLDRDNQDTEAVGRLLVPAPAQLIRLHPVSTEVNNVRNNGPELIEQAEPITDDD